MFTRKLSGKMKNLRWFLDLGQGETRSAKTTPSIKCTALPSNEENDSNVDAATLPSRASAPNRAVKSKLINSSPSLARIRIIHSPTAASNGTLAALPEDPTPSPTATRAESADPATPSKTKGEFEEGAKIKRANEEELFAESETLKAPPLKTPSQTELPLRAFEAKHQTLSLGFAQRKNLKNRRLPSAPPPRDGLVAAFQRVDFFLLHDKPKPHVRHFVFETKNWSYLRLRRPVWHASVDCRSKAFFLGVSEEAVFCPVSKEPPSEGYAVDERHERDVFVCRRVRMEEESDSANAAPHGESAPQKESFARRV